MICCEAFLRPILQFVIPPGLILGCVSILITPPDFSEMCSLDERASQSNNDTLVWWVVILFRLKSKPCLSWWGPLLRRLSPVFQAWSSLAIHPSGQEASPLQGLNPHLSFKRSLPSREALAPFFYSSVWLNPQYPNISTDTGQGANLSVVGLKLLFPVQTKWLL